MDSANIILGYRNPKIPTPAEMENEKLTINTLKNQNAIGQRQLQMQKELEGVTDPAQAVEVISKYDPIKGMEMRQKMQDHASTQSKDKRTLAVEGIGFYGKQASIISNIYDDSLKAGLTPEQAQQKVMPLFENTMSQGKQLYPDLPVSGDFDIDKIKQASMQSEEFMKQYNENKLHSRDRTEKLLDIKDEREYQELKTKQANNFDLSKLEIQRLNALEKMKLEQAFTGSQNAQSRAVSIRGQDKAAETAQARLNADSEKAKTTAKSKGMSVTAQKELIDAEDSIQGSKQAIDAFNKAKTINKKAMGGWGSGAIATAGTVLPNILRPNSVDATKELDNVLHGSALPQLKAIFGGMPTEGERAILLEVQGSSAQSETVREGIFDRAIEAANKRIKYNSQKVKQLRNGTYFTEDGGINMDDTTTSEDSSGLSVTAPNGKVYKFASKAAANAFKNTIGIK